MSIDHTSLAKGCAWPPATHILSRHTNTECSCRSFQITRDTSCFQSFPSREYHTSPRFCDGLLDQPPSTHIRSRYTTDENHSRAGHPACFVTWSQCTPSLLDHTSFRASFSG